MRLVLLLSLLLLFLFAPLRAQTPAIVKPETPPIIAPADQQAGFKPLYEAFLKAQADFNREGDPLTKEYDKKFEDLRKEYATKAQALKSYTAFSEAGKKLEDYKWQGLADMKLSSRSYEPIILEEKKELAYKLKPNP